MDQPDPANVQRASGVVGIRDGSVGGYRDSGYGRDRTPRRDDRPPTPRAHTGVTRPIHLDARHAVHAATANPAEANTIGRISVDAG
jgi:hypothetical protein